MSLSLFGQRLYLRIWLAVVAAVTVLTLVVGWLWQQALERDREEREARVMRTIIVENTAGDVLGDARASVPPRVALTNSRASWPHVALGL